jgi:hypothetical protein
MRRESCKRLFFCDYKVELVLFQGKLSEINLTMSIAKFID